MKTLKSLIFDIIFSLFTGICCKSLSFRTIIIYAAISAARDDINKPTKIQSKGYIYLIGHMGTMLLVYNIGV